MKLIITLSFAYCFSSGIAQTPLIAHKSHSGASNSYDLAYSSNFGAIQINLDERYKDPNLKPFPVPNFKPLNDSVIIVETADFDQNITKRDTLSNKEKFSVAVFEFRYKDSIRKKEIEESYKRELEQEEQLKKQQEESQKQLNEPVPVKKKKKSYLLFLFGITGGGMLLMRLFTRLKTTKPSIA